MSLEQEIEEIGANARRAARSLATLGSDQRNAILRAMAGQLMASAGQLLEANEKDVSVATDRRLAAAAIDRLRLNQDRISGMAEGIRQVADLDDPIGRSIAEWTRPNGLRITKVRTPIGVIGII